MTSRTAIHPELVEGSSFPPTRRGEEEQGFDKLSPNGEDTSCRLDAAIREALSRVHDPCSVAAGRPLSVLQMNLVLGWTLERGALHVTFAVTFPGCTMAPHFTEAAKAELLKIDGVDAVRCTVDTAHEWTGLPRSEMRGAPQAWRAR